MQKETQCVHSGTYRDRRSPGLNSPIFTSSAYEFRQDRDTVYPRYFNTPNQKVVIEKLCTLEEGQDGLLFGSGMAAISTAILAFAGAGDHVILLDELYGGTHAFATDEFERLGIAYSFVDTNHESLAAAMRENTRVVVIESPTNPLLNVIDVRKVAELAREKEVVSIIDNTFATPINQNPIRLGIDVVVHSGTKYLGGHHDLCCGVAVADSQKIDRIRSLARHLGGNLDALACYLLERSLKTLAIRVARQSENAKHLAEYLSRHSAVRKVNYPGLSKFRGHAIAARQMTAFGGMLSFEVGRRVTDTVQFLSQLKLIRNAVSLGGVETTICSPAVTSHAKISAEERRRIGVTDSLLRLSAGIEKAQDLIDDIEGALAGIDR
jgi:cystathionine beta-lyase